MDILAHAKLKNKADLDPTTGKVNISQLPSGTEVGTAENVSYDGTQTYTSGSVGAELKVLDAAKHTHGNKSAIDGISQSDITSWNAVTGKYEKPDSGIPKTDLASSVQTSLEKADSALQSVPNTYRTASEQDVIDTGKVNTTDYNPDDKTSAMTQSVGKDSSGKLWTIPGGGSGGTTDFEQLSNRPKYNSSTMTGDTNIPEVKTTVWDGKYSKPSSGIPSSDMSSAVQTSLSKADSALQNVPNTYRTASDQDTIDSGKQETLVSGTNIKTINNTSLLGSGNIDVGSSYILPQATSSALGGIKAEAATSADTQAVRIKPDGTLATAPSGGGGGSVSSVNGQTGAVVLGGEDIAYNSSAQSHTSGSVAAQLVSQSEQIVTLGDEKEAKGKMTVSGTEYSVTRKALVITDGGTTTTYYLADITTASGV